MGAGNGPSPQQSRVERTPPVRRIRTFQEIGQDILIRRPHHTCVVVVRMNRRAFLKTSAALAALPAGGCVTAGGMRLQSPYESAIPAVETGLVVNDLHSQLNATHVDAIVKPRTVEELRAAVLGARAAGKSVCVAGGRHAMGGQQFGDAAVLVDTRALNRFLCLDANRGLIDVEAGIQWPELIQQLAIAQEGQPKQWGITEIYVERPRLAAFMEDARRVLRERAADVIYGTVRLIERDEETFLAWARNPYGCVILNLHVEHTPDGVASAADTFRALIDLGIQHGGSYYLTYHRWARRDQVERCYPQMPEFLSLKRRHDPGELFQNTWYRHYRSLFA